MTSLQKNEYRTGLLCALGCAVLWGFLPLYWHALRPIDSFVIIFYRILMVGLTTFLGAWKLHGLERLKAPLKQKKMVVTFIFAGLLITANWSIYIWAVNANFVIQTCIGYYIEPLMVCLFGIFLFKEKLTRYKLVALSFATAGVVVVLIHFHEVPLIALSLALTFAIYAAIKKKYKIEPLIALFYETICLTPIALAMILYFEWTGKGAFSVAQPHQLILLAVIGLITAIPLGLFAMAANRVSLVTLGITEYLSPSISLLLSIFFFREPFDQIQLFSFMIIWVGLIYFTVGEMKESKTAEEELTEHIVVGE